MHTMCDTRKSHLITPPTFRIRVYRHEYLPRVALYYWYAPSMTVETVALHLAYRDTKAFASYSDV